MHALDVRCRGLLHHPFLRRHRRPPRHRRSRRPHPRRPSRPLDPRAGLTEKPCPPAATEHTSGITNSGRPIQLQSFNGRFRDEFLACEQFNTLLEVQVLAEDWRIEYNTYRPHGSLDDLTPQAFRTEWITNQTRLP